MASKNTDNQYDNFVSICKGYQLKEPDMQPRMPHPHLVQHSMAIILRVRPSRNIQYLIENDSNVQSSKNTASYIPPNYTESAEVMVPDANPQEIEGADQGNVVKITPGFIKILPKLTERKCIADTIWNLKNRSVGYLPAEEIDNHFRNQYGFDTYGASVEYLVLRRAKDSQIEDIDDKDNRNNVFAGYTSLPGGVNNYGENSLDSVVRNTYEQTGYDLTDHTKFCLVAQSSKNYIMRYLPNKRVIVAKPFIFCQLVPGILPIPKPTPVPGIVSMYLWTHVDFLYKCDINKHLEYREITTEMLKRNLKNVKLAQLKIANAENYSLIEVVNDPKKCDPMFSLCGPTLGMLLSLLESAPAIYDKRKYAALQRKQFSIQLKRFNPQYLGFVGDYISKYTVNKYLMNLDKKWWADYEERTSEINYLYVFPSVAAATTFLYLIGRKKRSEENVPAIAKI